MKRKAFKRLLRNFRRSQKKGRELLERAAARGDYRLAYELSEQLEMLSKVIDSMKEAEGQ